jgi:hypothetical protein
VLALVWLPVGSAMIAVPAWLAVTRWEVLLTGHPALPATAVACALLGATAVIWAAASLVIGGRVDAEGDNPDRPQPRTLAQRRRRARVRIAFAVPALAFGLLLTSWLVYARPLAAAPEAVAVLRGGPTLRVNERITWFELVPDRRTRAGDPIPPTTGLVFVPGARIDPRAYARVLRPVAAAGYLVIVLKEPFGFALPTSQHPARVMALHPEIRYWAVGGHSLGGVLAAGFADRDEQVDGLLLYASYPATAVTRTGLKVTSISGDADTLATPEDIAAAKAKLPKATRYQVVKGAVHAYFGDYGEQPGDGTPTIDRETAQAQIAKGTTALLASLRPPPRKR